MRSPMSDCETGEWYLVITCEKCKTSQPLIHDLSRGKSEIVVVPEFTLIPLRSGIEILTGQKL